MFGPHTQALFSVRSCEGSGILVECLKDVVTQLHISSHFIGIILLPIVGNACEHAAAIRFAIQETTSQPSVVVQLL